MRLRYLLRRLTVSAPRMAVRSALPWPFRWVVAAVVAGFCAAIALWAFELGKDIAGLDHGIKQQLLDAQSETAKLHSQLEALTTARNKAQSVANTIDTVLATEKQAQEKLLNLNKQLSAENQRLKDDLGFFEQLIPASNPNAGSLAIRALQAEMLKPNQLKWQVLVVQAAKKPVEFNGQLEVTFTGSQNGKTWSASLPGGAQALKLSQYGRVEGLFDVPQQTVVRALTAKVLEGSSTKAVQSIKLR